MDTYLFDSLHAAYVLGFQTSSRFYVCVCFFLNYVFEKLFQEHQKSLDPNGLDSDHVQHFVMPQLGPI